MRIRYDGDVGASVLVFRVSSPIDRRLHRPGV